MSQHIYKHDNVVVLMGYDRPLDFVFCTIEIDDEIVYSNLGDINAGTEMQDVEYYRHWLTKHNIEVPEQMFEEVKEDQRNQIGNRVKLY